MNCGSQNFQASAHGALSTSAAERALRVSERRNKKDKQLVIASSSPCSSKSTTEETSYVTRKEKKVSLLMWANLCDMEKGENII
jgi:hypothetical protein